MKSSRPMRGATPADSMGKTETVEAAWWTPGRGPTPSAPAGMIQTRASRTMSTKSITRLHMRCLGAAAAVAAAVLSLGAATALAQYEGVKDRDKLREDLRSKMNALHKEVIEKGTDAPVIDVEKLATADMKNGAAEPQKAIGEGPRLVFERSGHDFGVITGEDSLICKFPFKNMGTERLVINAINTGCGCTVAKLAKQEFEPGEGDVIEITYNPKGSGKQSRSISVTSNDAHQPNMQLVVSAQVIPLCEARPNTVQFGQVSIGDARTVQCVIVSRDPELKVISVECNGPEIAAELAPAGTRPEVMVEPELPGVAVINVTLKDSAPVGRVLRMVTVKALAAKEPGGTQEPQEIKVNAFAAVKGELSVNPQLIRVPPVVAGGDIERDAIVTRKDNRPFKITKAEIHDANITTLTVTTEPYKEGEVIGYKVKLVGKAGPVANNFRGRIVLTTDVPREEEIEIQFSGIVRVPPPTTTTPTTDPTGTTPPQAPVHSAPPKNPN